MSIVPILHRLPAQLLLPLMAVGALGCALGVEPGKTGEGDFPALQFLPVGSEVYGISLPRYKGAKPIYLIKASKLKVVSRKSVVIEKLAASLYGDGTDVTSIKSEGGKMDFSSNRLQTLGLTSIGDPRFRAQGDGVIYDTERKRGLMLGPVRCIIQAKPKEKTP